MQIYAKTITIRKDINNTLTAYIEMTDGVVETINWNDTRARKQFAGYIKASTIIVDERAKDLLNSRM